MGKRKKKKPNTPRHKRLKRQGRLQAAEHWIPKYDGKNLVKGYAKHFGLNQLGALTELEMLGYTYSETYKQKLKDIEILKQREAEKRNAAKKKKRQQMEVDFWDEESDETFAFIAGYTSGGAPYGITWEEWEADNSKSGNASSTVNIENLCFANEDECISGNEPLRNEDKKMTNNGRIDINSDDLPF